MKMKETIYKRALLKWGERAQLEMAQEESTELALAIRKFIRKPNEKTIDHLAEEMADVEITTEQIKEMYPSILEKIEVHKSFKLDRLSKRLDENKFEE